jgi:hypothetical protein
VSLLHAESQRAAGDACAHLGLDPEEILTRREAGERKCNVMIRTFTSRSMRLFGSNPVKATRRGAGNVVSAEVADRRSEADAAVYPLLARTFSPRRLVVTLIS